MKRRQLLLGGLGLGLGGAWLARPEAFGGAGHTAYFASLSALLREQQLARPTMLVDLDRLDHNIAELRRHIPADKAYRIVAKSLPAPGLIDYVMRGAQTRRLMVFHQPFLNQLAARYPDSDLLLGKPMPVDAAARFYRDHQPNDFALDRQLQWLIDSPERLAQYAKLAEARQQPLRLNIEIDIGLHRGGLQSVEVFARILRQIDAHPLLHFGGLMGYDPHVAKAPTVLDLQRREATRAHRLYADYLKVWREYAEQSARRDALVLNAAGSPTFRRWHDDPSANELAAGSGLVKPLDFDVPGLDSHQPALFIATPILKRSDGLDLPVAPILGDMQSWWNPNRRKTLFVYGGYWKARPVSPAGLHTNPLYGHSSNQEMLNAGENLQLGVDDYVFYRPTQSEFVMLQFGDLIAVRQGQIEAVWPTLV